MKAIFHALLCVLLICVICSGCTENFEIRCTPVEVAHITDRETFDIFGVFHREERWFVKYERTFPTARPQKRGNASQKRHTAQRSKAYANDAVGRRIVYGY